MCFPIRHYACKAVNEQFQLSFNGALLKKIKARIFLNSGFFNSSV